MDWCFSDTWRVIGERLTAERVENLELGLAQRRCHAIFHASRGHPNPKQLAALPDPIAAGEPKTEARGMSQGASWRIDHPDDHRSRSIGGGLKWSKPVLGNFRHQ